MKYIPIGVLIILFITSQGFADVKLYHFTDKTTGDERGISYSDKDGNPPVLSPEWDFEEIQESDKEHFIKLQQQQIKQEHQQAEQTVIIKKNRVIARLKALGFLDDEIEVVIK